MRCRLWACTPRGAIAARLEDEHLEVREAAVKVLGKMGVHAKEHAEAIVARLQDEK